MGAIGYGASGAVNVGAAIYGAQQQWKAGAYNKAMGEYDAQQLDQLARDAIDRGETEASRIGIDGKRLVGSQRAAIAGQGIDVSSGTAQALQLDTLTQTERDMKTARLNAMAEAKGLRAKATSTRIQGRMAKESAGDQATGTLLTGGAQAINAGAQAYGSVKAK